MDQCWGTISLSVQRQSEFLVREVDCSSYRSAGLLGATEKAILAQDQAGAAAAVALYGELGHSPRPVFDLLLKYAVSQDGALHAEKYYQTVSEEFIGGRPEFRWNHLIGLARVTASEFGWPAPGHEDATRLLIG